MSLVALLGALCVPAPVGALRPQQAPQAPITADTPLTEVRTRAAQGDASAQNSLGYRYVTGEGVPQDFTKAVRWYRLSAEQGNAVAQNNLGVRYGNGEGVPQDFSAAMRWYLMAAEQGLAAAQDNLGMMYRNGEGVAQDFKEAVRWYRLSAEQGDAAAQYNLGAMYGTGRGVPRDYVEAHTWRTLAASRATGDNKKRYAETRDAVAKAMTEAQLAEAQTRADDWEAAFALRKRR
jgi:hypothetical protein